MIHRLGILLIVAGLFVAACTTAETGGSDTLPTNTGDAPPAAGACLEGEPDCNDTGDMAAPGPLPVSNDSPSVGMPAEGGLTVSEALATDATGTIAIQGFLLVDQSGARLCDALAESYPPQCGGASVPIVDYEEMVDVPLASAQGVTWTDTTVTFCGELVDGVFTVDPTVSC